MQCREGILFALSRQGSGKKVDYNKPPPHLNFLFILAEFSHRLLAVDRSGERGVLPFLMKQLPEGQFKRIKGGKCAGWDALLAYYRSTGLSKSGVAPTPVKKGRKRLPQRGKLMTGMSDDVASRFVLQQVVKPLVPAKPRGKREKPHPQGLRVNRRKRRWRVKWQPLLLLRRWREEEEGEQQPPGKSEAYLSLTDKADRTHLTICACIDRKLIYD